jgi:hypothetical protein
VLTAIEQHSPEDATLRSKLKSLPEPVKFPANIDLVVKNYDKINAAMPPIQ